MMSLLKINLNTRYSGSSIIVYYIGVSTCNEVQKKEKSKRFFVKFFLKNEPGGN